MSIETLTTQSTYEFDTDNRVIPSCFLYIQPNSGGWDDAYDGQSLYHATTAWTEFVTDDLNHQYCNPRYLIWGPPQVTDVALQFDREVTATYITGVWVDSRHEYGDINRLRFNGHSDLAKKLELMLHQINEDPDEPNIDDASLSQLSTFFINHRGWPVPFIGPNRRIIYAQWSIYSNGVFIVGFRGADFQLVVNVDSDRSGERVLISKRVDEEEIIKAAEEHGPLRY